MQSRTGLFAVIILISLASAGFAQETVITPESVIMTSGPNRTVTPSFPYMAEITGDNVNVRSGPGTNYYRCGKLNKGDRVKVVNQRVSWSCIVPPPGSFSWISTQYVGIDANNPTVGTVTGDNVHVWVGGVDLRPIYSTTWRLKLNRGEKVKLLGEEQDKYYKIAPPTGTYRWVRTEYTKALGPVGEVRAPVVVRPSDSNAVVPTRLPVEAKKLEEYYALERQMHAERTKPTEQQSYANIKKALLKLGDDKKAGKAARYAKFAIRQIERCELALRVAKAVRLQDAQLQQTKEGIEKAAATRLAEFQDLGRFAAIGQFQTFETYGPGHYRIIDRFGQTLCYTLPIGPASRMDLSNLVGRRVGLVGTIEPHPPTKGALVRFTEIVGLK